MATLINHTDQDLFVAALHVTVPARSSVEIADADEGKVNLDTGLLSVARAEASRTTVKRGSRTAEVSGPPEMETR